MSRGQTLRVRRLIDHGSVTPQLLAAADHEADLLAQPYIGIEHVELAHLRLAGREQERVTLRAGLAPGVPHRPWRPRGRCSALSRQGLAETRGAQRRAEAVEQRRTDGR
jgi:hypothetical protein